MNLSHVIGFWRKNKLLIGICHIWSNSRKKIKDWVRENNANEKNGQQVYEEELELQTILLHTDNSHSDVNIDY